MILDDSNSWPCELHAVSNCRIYPRTKAALEKHYVDSAKGEICSHQVIKRNCRICMNKPRKSGREGRKYDPLNKKNLTGIRNTVGGGSKYG